MLPCRPVWGEEIDGEEADSFWAFRVPERSDPPEVANEGWARTIADRFILHRMEREGLDPAPEADRETIARRLYFDLTGLPPAQGEVDRFLIDASRDPYEALVYRLLRSARFGERMASLWLPVVRYADDSGSGKITGAHYYRQWVVDAFNRDLPYDRFIRLQLAADFYGEDDREALGFLGLGIQSGDRRTAEVMAEEWAGQVDTVTRGFLGLTVACARCHDHFHDPIPTEDYYSLAGVFASSPIVLRKAGERAQYLVEEGEIRDLPVFIRGDVTNEGAVVPRGFPSIFQVEGGRKIFRKGSGRRELAEAIASPSNPLAARVMVNRVWGEILGTSLVASPSNFGRSGSLPSHPELLDDLAVRFVENGWSIKWLVRELVLSSTYRQVVIPREEGDSSYVGMPRRRLTAEMLRDAMLAITGELMFDHGAPLRLEQPSNYRRTIFGHISRRDLNDFLRHFDYPSPGGHAPKREITTNSTQKLFLLNSPFVQARASRLAADLRGDTGGAGLDTLYFRLFSRPPTRAERAIAIKFFERTEIPGDRRWEKLAQVLLCSNTFLYRE